MPRGYSRTLPRLHGGPSAGLPRVYDLALETIAHGDARVDPASLSGFVTAYQTVTHLNLGELWAIPIMLRLALIENLRRVAAAIATDRLDRNLADKWADEMTKIAEKDPKNLILVIADMARSNPPMVSSFIAELVRRLQGQGLLWHCRLPGSNNGSQSRDRRSSNWCSRRASDKPPTRFPSVTALPA